MRTLGAVITFLLVVILPLPGTDVHAQVAIASLAPGDLIRVNSAPGVTISGQLLRLDGDSLAFSTRGVPEVLLPVAQLHGLQVAQQGTFGVGRGALTGLLGGILVGGLLGGAMFAGGDEGTTFGSGFVFGGAVLALPGALIGALVGSGRTVTRWVEVSLPATTDE